MTDCINLFENGVNIFLAGGTYLHTYVYYYILRTGHHGSTTARIFYAGSLLTEPPRRLKGYYSVIKNMVSVSKN